MYIDISNTVLETPRLILRGWKEEDLNDLFEYASTPGVGEWAGWPHHENIETSARILQGWLEKKNVFAIALRESGKAVGSLGLHNSRMEEEAEYAGRRIVEIGYVLGKPYWGQGLMTEAVKRVIDYLFQEKDLDTITISHREDNARSRRVIEKCGFTFVKAGTHHAKQLDRDFADRQYVLVNPRKK